MSLAMAARIARREMRGGIRGFRVFLACLALGVAAIAAVGSVRASIEAGLAREGAVLLGGDAAVEFTYRFADEDERAYLAGISTALSEIVDFRSMAVVGEDRALTQVKAVDGAYPLLGEVGLEPEMSLDDALAGAGGLPGAVMEPILIERLGIAPGAQFRLGDQEFVLMAALSHEPDNAGGGFALGPRTLVLSQDLAASGLLAPGTLFSTQYRLRLPEGSDLAALAAQTKERLSGSAIRWRDSRDGARGVRVFVERLGSFLVLVGLAGLAVGGVGISSAVRAYLEEKTETIATLKTLGASGRMIFQIYLIQIGALTALGLLIGLVLGAAVPVLLSPVITAALPLPADYSIHPRPLAEAALYGTLAALLFTLWPLAQARDVRAAALFRDAHTGLHGWPRAPYVVLSALVLAALVAVAAAFSGVVPLALWSAVGVIAAFLALVLAGWAVRRLSRFLAGRGVFRGRPVIRMALASVGGPGNEAAAVVLSLGLGLSVLAAVGQVDNNLRGAISRELPDRAPSFFVLDIQPGQVDAFMARLDGDPGVSRVDTAPMLRGMITKINGRPAQEVAGNHWAIRGDRGLTYSAELPERSTLTEGQWWAPDYAGPPLISFSAEEAGEIGLKLGDTLSVNVMGREITGTIANFRRVDFSNAGMGFVMAMNPSALAGAPHSFIATIYADEPAEAQIMRDLSGGYPNITLISMRSAISQISAMMGRIAAAITYGALATLVTGAVVLIGAAAAGVRARTYEAAVLKTLGASRAAILANFALRAAILGAAAGLVAVAAGGIAGWAVTHFVMEADFAFEPVSAITIVTGGVLVTVLTGLGFALRPLSARPARVLRARE